MGKVKQSMSSPILLSVIICSHNPRSEYLSRVLQALDRQSLSKDLWELILIDNASEKILSQEVDISWHPHSRHVLEDRLGLTPARLRGIEEAIAETLIFVDDDNVLDSDYLEVALQISKDCPFIGAWGGQSLPEFEREPPEWIRPYWELLALNEFDRDSWSNLPFNNTHPAGAGMCVRKVVADRYTNISRDHPKRISLDRKGKSLISCGDTDLAFTACDLGLGIGRFTKLKLTHLIPNQRLNEDYLLRLTEAASYSVIILRSLREDIPQPSITSWRSKIIQFYYQSRISSRERRFFIARKKGEATALKDLFP